MVRMPAARKTRANLWDEVGRTALLWVVQPAGEFRSWRVFEDVFRAFIQAGSSIEERDNEGLRAIDFAIKCCDEEAVEVLRQAEGLASDHEQGAAMFGSLRLLMG
jgi:hypothetical protein